MIRRFFMLAVVLSSLVGAAGIVQAGGISGRVTDHATGTAVAGAWVSAFNPVAGQRTDAFTDGNGDYALPSLSAGTYVLRFVALQSGHFRLWYGGADDALCATPVPVAGQGTVAGINASLVQGGSISGRVTDRETGNPVPAAIITLQTQGMTERHIAGLSSADGTYLIKGIDAGTYTLGARADSHAPGEIRNLAVSLSQTTPGGDVRLERGSSISGKVSDRSTGSGIAGVTVYAINTENESWPARAVTDAAGGYRVAGLTAGTYFVGFQGEDHIPVRYGSGQGGAGARAVTVAADAGTTGIDAALERGGTITGRLIDQATGQLIDQASIGLIDATTGTVIGNQMNDSPGTYRITGLASGTYRIRAVASPDQEGGDSLVAESPPLALAAPAAVSGIDLTLARGGSIRGNVSASACPAPRSVMVNLYDRNTGRWVDRAWIPLEQAPGQFTIDGLADGDYVAEFEPSDRFHRQWHGGTDLESAEVIRVRNGAGVTGINALLTAGGGGISGTVTTAAALPSSFTVKLFDRATERVAGMAQTDEKGRYQFTGIKQGDYLLFFEDSPRHSGQWYSIAGSGTPTVIRVVDGVASSSVDALFSPEAAYVPNGDVDGNGRHELKDVIAALRGVVGSMTLTTLQSLRGDVAPLINGAPAPDGKITIQDAVLILRRALGHLDW